MTSKKRVAIIGGGISGLYATYRLSLVGYDVSLYEKEKKLGGEIAGFSFGDTLVVEKFYHHIFLHDQAVYKLFEELGLSDKIAWYRSNVAVLHHKKSYPFNTPLDLLKVPFISFCDKIRMGLSLVILPLIDYKRLEKITAYQLVRHLMGENVWREFWGPIFKLKFGTYGKKVTGVWIWGRLKDRLQTRNGQETLGYPNGGFDILIDRLSDRLTRQKAKIHLGVEINSVEKKGRLFEVAGEKYDKIILATALPTAIMIAPLSKKKKKELSKIIHLAAVTVCLRTKGKITDVYWTNVLDADLPFGVIVEQTNLVKSEKPGQNLIYLGRYFRSNDPLYQKTDKELVKSFIASLDQVYAGAKNKIINYRVFRDPYAQPVFKVGDKQVKPKTAISGLYILSAASIYPFDRGLDRSIRLVDKLIAKYFL